ncbi:spore germination protein [Cohnella sp. CFH 77786]|uniref:spore germination protein n=1 Tax=Cohnella sp. CFH 77786 TaxID=2662265 RepID=UPI001C60AAFC|nr:spore germination protein [Cohnella sp. CFH 77786]MBW5445133.1 spore germination protein [Cohnella sp. CFH 77786]
MLQLDIGDALDYVKQSFGGSPDVIVRILQLGSHPGVRMAVVHIDGLTDKGKINEFVAQSLLLAPSEEELRSMDNQGGVLEVVLKRTSTVGDAKACGDWNFIMHALLSGDIVILLDGSGEAIVADLRKFEGRAVAEPTTEVTVRGPKDSFIESIDANIALVRRRLKSVNLWLETFAIGRISKTDVAILYIHGVADNLLVQEVRNRLTDIKIEAIQGSGNIEELIRDQTFTPFPTVFNTERPDMAVANLLEGRVAVIVDGTPFILIAPTNFSQFFKTTEDYYQRFDFGFFMRIIRYFSFFVTLLLPSSYIALTTFHHEMIPTVLVINLLAQREGIPFPAFFEAMLMEAAFEIMREAGVRMPRAVGQAVSIVGAIVLGSAAVEAGVVTAMMVIIVSLTGIASFATPGIALSNAVRMIRFPMMLLASTFGFYGLMMGMIFLVAHMTSLKSFGVPYLYPFSPYDPWRQKDTIWRSPLKTARTRPDLTMKQGTARGDSERERHET